MSNWILRLFPRLMDEFRNFFLTIDWWISLFFFLLIDWWISRFFSDGWMTNFATFFPQPIAEFPVIGKFWDFFFLVTDCRNSQVFFYMADGWIFPTPDWRILWIFPTPDWRILWFIPMNVWWISRFYSMTYWWNSQVFFMWSVDEFHNFFPTTDWRISVLFSVTNWWICNFFFTWPIYKFHDTSPWSNDEINDLFPTINRLISCFLSCDHKIKWIKRARQKWQ